MKLNVACLKRTMEISEINYGIFRGRIKGKNEDRLKRVSIKWDKKREKKIKITDWF